VLGLGLDSFLFLDDNPVEIATVRSALAEVLSVTCPPSSGLRDFLGRLWPLVPAAETAEDALRTRFYEQERDRDAARARTGFEEFLARSELEVDIRALSETDVERAGQLVRRTDQFTLRARSADGGDLARWQERGEVWTATARDRFGDYGQIGLLALHADGDRLDVPAWVLRQLPVSQMLRMAKAYPDAEVRIVDAGHELPVERPEELTSTIDRFLA
jgi:FkbH-like protein